MKAFTLTAILWVATTSNAHAGYELVCIGYYPQSNHKTVEVDCNNRKEFIETLGRAWTSLRQNSIGGSMENLCREAYRQARGLHPSLGMRPDMASSFLMRCNMGLQYVQD
jgi:hypothetical protein